MRWPRSSRRGSKDKPGPEAIEHVPRPPATEPTPAILAPAMFTCRAIAWGGQGHSEGQAQPRRGPPVRMRREPPPRRHLAREHDDHGHHEQRRRSAPRCNLTPA